MLASKADRLGNFIIDTILILLVTICISLIINIFNGFYLVGLIYFSVHFLYYFCFEYWTGKTPGKMVTKTKVVSRNCNKPGAVRILFRTLTRFIKLDYSSFIFGTEIGMHDTFSRTYVLKENIKD